MILLTTNLKSLIIILILNTNFFLSIMFTGDDDLLNLIQVEANTLVDNVLDESVSILNNSASSLIPSSFKQESEQQDLSREVSIEENDSFEPQPSSFQLPLILNNNNNNSMINPPTNNLSDHAQISDEISENFAIKSDYDIIVKSPTIESMSGKSFEDDEINFTTTPSSTIVHDVSLDDNNHFVSVLHSNDNITAATNITPSTSVPSHELDIDGDREEIVQIEAQKLVDDVLEASLDIVNNPENFQNFPSSSGVRFASSSEDESEEENDAIVRNINEHKLHRVERKFEHLSSEVRDDDSATVDDLVNKEDISQLQTDFSKISWDESLSPTTGDFGSSTPDNDLQEVLNLPTGDTYRQLHNK
jgi:hypothetical protein